MSEVCTWFEESFEELKMATFIRMSGLLHMVILKNMALKTYTLVTSPKTRKAVGKILRENTKADDDLYEVKIFIRDSFQASKNF